MISGFYHAHDNLRDNHVDVFSQKIADKVPCSTQSDAELTPPLPGSGEPARHLAGDDRLEETVGEYRVSKSDRPAALGRYVSRHGLLGLG